MICILEDMDVRVDALREKLPNADIRHARTVTEFLALPLDQAKVIVLDHDLGDLHTDSFEVGEDGLSGLDAVKRMEPTLAKIYIWSYNAPKAVEMGLTLKDKGMRATYSPFSDMTVNSIVYTYVGM